MANWTILKQAIANVIKTNGNQEITGAVLQNTLNSIVNTVGENATFVGIATPTTNPGIPDGPVFYFANTTGVYSNFSDISIDEMEIDILIFNGLSWEKLKVIDLSDFKNIKLKISEIDNRILLLEDNANAIYKKVYGNIEYNDLSLPAREIIEAKGGGIITNYPDEEDITSIEENSKQKIRFADRNYEPLAFSGKGYKILRKNIVEGKNILTQDMINESNTMYEIRYDFDLDSAIINMPYNSFLLFKGGTIINGTILNLKQEVCPEDFGAKGDGIADDYAAVLMAINSSNTINFKGSYNFKGKTLLLEKKQNFLIFNRSNTEYNIINGTIKLGGSLKFITIDGIRINNSNKLEYGIFAEGNINILRLKNLYVTKCSTAGISLVNCYDCYISKCSCTSNNIGLYMKNCFSSNVIKSNAYYNNIGVKVDGDASTNYNMTIQENLYTGFEGLSIVACTLNLYLEQNGYKGTNNKEKSQIYLGSLPSEEITKGCLCRLYCIGGKGSEMESPYNLYLNGASSNLIVGSYYRSTVTDIYITSSYNTNNIVLSNKDASVVNGNPSNKINNEVPNKDSDDLSIGEYIFTSKPYFKSANGLIDCFGNSSTFKAVDNYANRPNGVSGSVFLNKDKSYTPSICINGSDYIDVQPIIHSTDTKNVLIGTLCYDLKKKRIAAFNGDIFVATNGFNINFNINGATEDRPTLNQEHSGFQYYDTTLKKYIVWNGTEWTNMDGTALG